MARIIWSPKSLRQVDEIAEYIALDSVDQARRVARQIYDAPLRLKSFPEFGAVVPEVTERMVREIHVFSYRILYELHENNTLVRIVGVIHGARQLTEETLEE